MKTKIPIAIAFVSGAIMLIAFFFDAEKSVFGQASEGLLMWSSIIGGFTFLLGGISITRVNWTNVARRKSGWGFSLVTVIGVFIMLIPALIPSSWLPSGMTPLVGRGTGSIYDWLFTIIFTPMSQTMFAVLAFYIASAAYRAFRARSAEATLLLLTAALIMFWRVPMGEAFLNNVSHFLESITGGRVSLDLPGMINTYLMGGINMAVQRGIIIGAALGAASMSLRILLGIERTYLGKG
jgi:hypothetical protein